jgi:hypothetical protein
MRREKDTVFSAEESKNIPRRFPPHGNPANPARAAMTE